MSDLLEMRCPNCGAPFKVEGDSPTAECPFCGTVVMIPPEMRRAPQPATVPAAPSPEFVAPPIAAPRKKTSPLGCVLTLAVLAVIVLISALIPNRSRSITNTGGLLVKPTATALPISRELSSPLPREVSYAGFGIQIAKGVIDNREDRNDTTTFLRDGAFARLDGTLTNSTKEDLYLDAQLFKLRLGNGKLYPLDPGIVLAKNFAAPDPGASNDVSFVFPVPFDAQWDGAALVVTDGTGEPAELPLTGDAPKSIYPLALALPANATVDAGGITYQLTKAAVGLDSGSKRAAKGARFLYLDLHITNPTGKYGVNISSDDFRVIVSGSSAAPIDFPIAVIDYQSSLDGRVVFSIPAAAKTAQVQFGDVRAENIKFGVMTLDLNP